MKGLVLFLLLISSAGFALAGWQLSWSDEFDNQNKLNTSVWNVFYQFSPQIINQELEFYSPDSFTFLDNSMVRIVAQHRPFWTYHLNYTSGVMTTLNKFSQAYGYFELKARLPKGTGFWPAFWLLPTSAHNPLEIDIFEILEQDPTTVYTTFHCDYNNKNPLNKGSSAHLQQLADGGFHTYGLQWIPGTLIWYVDGAPIWNLSNSCVPNTPEYILINMAIGGDWPKPPNNQTPFPSYMDVDYVRVYTQLGAGRGLSLPGQVGQGIAFSPPKIDPPAAAITLGLIKATPETVAGSGSYFQVSITLHINNGTWNNMKLQFALNPYTLSPIGKQPIVTATLEGLNWAAGNSYTRVIDVQIPGGTSNGFYIGEIGIFTENWHNIFWQSATVMIGVGKDYIIGGQP